MKTKRISSVLCALLLVLTMLFGSVTVGITASAEEGTIKNVIIMIGDGMGPNHLNWVEQEKDVDLVMNTFPYQGFSQTNSLSGTTDSAAGGTALACGQLTKNGNIGCKTFGIEDVASIRTSFKSISEIARDKGMKTGVLTSDSNAGATPAAFSAHTTDRGNGDDISTQQLKSSFDLIWSEDDAYVTRDNAAENGFTYVENALDVQGLTDGTRSFGQFHHVCFDDGSKSTTPLSILTTLAIKQLDNDNGFFLMVEGAHIDKYSHNNDKENMMNALLEFDKAISNALDFAKEDGETLIIVTADHETGGIKNDDGTFTFTKTGHSSADVPVKVYGKEGLVKDGSVVRNIQIPQFAAKALGAELPVLTNNPSFFLDFFKVLFQWIKDALTIK